MKAINILLVEDDLIDVIEIRRSLDRINIIYQLTVSKNGEEALRALGHSGPSVTAELPDLILIDINMPKMSGFELLEEIRTHENWRHLKCFIITTSNGKTDRRRADELGVSGYLIKPLKLNSPATIDGFNLMIDLMNFKSFE